MKKNSQTKPRKTSLKSIRPDEKLAAGIDVHKSTHTLAIWSETRGEIVFQARIPADSLAIIEKLGPIRNQLIKVVYEAGPTGYHLARTLMAHDFPVEVVSPAHTPVGTSEQDKNDQRDARRLAQYAAKEMLSPIYIPTEIEEEERALVRHREDLVRKIRKEKQQIRSALLLHGIEEPEKLRNWSKIAMEKLRTMAMGRHVRTVIISHLNTIDFLKRELAKIDAALDELLSQDDHRETAERLQKIPGVGRVTVLAFLLELLNVNRFDNPREVARFLALSPCLRSSGDTVRQMGRVRGGSVLLRSVLVEAAWRWVSNDNEATKRFEEHCIKTGSRKKAIVAMARRLGTIMWRMARDGGDYETGYWKSGNPQHQAAW